MHFNPVYQLGFPIGMIVSGDDFGFNPLLGKCGREVIRTQRSSCRWGVTILVEDENFHGVKKIKKTIVVRLWSKCGAVKVGKSGSREV